MTRRTLVYEENEKYYVSQDFNGDKAEALLWDRNTVLNVNWEEILPIFNNVNTLCKFRKAVKKAENMYGYENIPLSVKREVPRCEEVWKQKDKTLKLYAKYDEEVE